MEKLKIGVIINQLEGPFFSSQKSSLIEVSEKYNISLTFFTGKPLNSTNNYDVLENFTYDLVQTDNLDGLIVYSGSLWSGICENTVMDMLSKWSHIPLVVMSDHIEEYPGITNNSSTAIKELVDHLVNVHHYKDFGLVSGAEKNYDSISRLKYVKTFLNNHGITLNDDKIYRGNFMPEDGYKAAEYFIQTGVPEVIICLNDDMAITLIEYLKNNGFSVPGDVAVTGFDGYRYTEKTFPALTTIKQPFTSMAEAAFKLLIEEMKGNYDLKGYVVESELNIMQSCGCIVTEDLFRDIEPTREDISAKEILIDQFKLIDRVVHRDSCPSSLSKAFFSIINRDDCALDKDILKDLYLLNNKAATQIEYYHTYRLFNYHWRLRDVISKISGKVRREEILEEITKTLPGLGFNFIRVFLYESPVNCYEKKRAENKILKLHLSYNSGEESFISNDGVIVDLAELYNSDYSTSVRLIYFGDDILGILQLDIAEVQDIVFSDINDVISNAMHISYMNMKVLKAGRTLEASLAETRILNSKLKGLATTDEMTGLLNRRGFMEKAEDLISVNQSEYFYILYMDMDGLKKINDTYGHDEGDWAISNLALALKSSFRINDIISRFGGDEFISLISSNDKNYPDILSKRLEQELDRINKQSDKEFTIRVSIGAVMFKPDTEVVLSDLLHQADMELYKVKAMKYAK